MVTLHKSLEGAVNVYTMDFRGDGRGTLLDCASGQSMTSVSQSDSLMYMMDGACAQILQNQYGDLASFSVTSAATDISIFISNHTNGASTIVYGVSAGTMQVQRLMQLDPPSVNGYVLDGAVAYAVTPDKKTYWSDYDADFASVGETFMKLCAQDRDCASHFKATSLSATLHHLLQNFDSNPNSTCAALVANSSQDEPVVVLQTTLGGLLLDSSTRSLIPPLVHRLNRCDSYDVNILTVFFATASQKVSVPDKAEAYVSGLHSFVETFSEMWKTPSPTYDDLYTRAKTLSMTNYMTSWYVPYYCLYSKERSPACDGIEFDKYEANPMIYRRDKFWGKTAIVSSHASVLQLHGRLDPMNPYKHGESLFKALDTSKKELIAFDYAPRVTIETTPYGDGGKNCGMELLLSFVRSNADLKRVDKSCVGKMPAFNMKVAPELVSTYFGTEDVYDGVSTRAEHNGRVKPAF